MLNYPKIKNAKALQDLLMEVEFENGIVKYYDYTNFINRHKVFELKDFNFFKSFTVDTAGYGIIWNDDIDIAEAELWTNGTLNIPEMI